MGMQNGISPSPRAAQPAKRLHTLDGMRGVAAIMVAIFHYSHRSAPAGYLAVDLFFVMSGVVLAQAYTERLREGMSPLAFLKARYERLYPLYFAGLAVGLAMAAFAPVLPLKQGLASLPSALLMLPAPLFHNGLLFPFNQPSWSLFYELVINVWLAVALFRASSRFLMGLLCAGATVLIVLAWQGHPLDLGARIGPVQIVGGLGRVCFSFSCGLLLYRWCEGHARVVGWAALLIVALTMLMLVVPASPRLLPWRDLMLAVFVSPLLVAAAARVEPPAALRRVFQLLGDISYPLYAVHLPTIVVWQVVLGRSRLPLGAQLAIYVGGLVVLSAALVRWYDEPVRSWIARQTRIRESAPSQLL